MGNKLEVMLIYKVTIAIIQYFKSNKRCIQPAAATLLQLQHLRVFFFEEDIGTIFL